MQFGVRAAAISLAWVMGAATAMAMPPAPAPVVQMDRAETVVVGTLVKANTWPDGTGTLQVTEVLKGDKDLKTVPVRFAARRQVGPNRYVTRGGGNSFEQGATGIWMLLESSKKRKDAYHVGWPNLHIAGGTAAQGRAMLAQLAMCPWSQPVNGLAVRVLMGKPHPTVPHESGYIGFRNCGEQPLSIAVYEPAGRLQIHVVGPDGRRTAVPYQGPALVPGLQPDGLAPVGGGAGPGLVRLMPGETSYDVFPYGVNLERRDARPGGYTLTVTYSSQGPAAPGMWRGTVTAPPAVYCLGLEVDVQPARPAFAPDDPLEFKVTMRNVSAAPLGLYDSSHYPAWDWRFLSADGKVLRHAAIAAGEHVRPQDPEVVERGKASVTSVNLSAAPCRYEQRGAGRAERSEAALPAGRYFLSIALRLDSPELWPKSGPLALWMGPCVTAPVEFTVAR